MFEIMVNSNIFLVSLLTQRLKEILLHLLHLKNMIIKSCFCFFLQAHEDAFPSVVRSAMLQVVFDRANLSLPSVSDEQVKEWLTSRLPPLLVQLSPGQVAPYFGILAGRSCSIEQLG